VIAKYQSDAEELSKKNGYLQTQIRQLTSTIQHLEADQAHLKTRLASMEKQAETMRTQATTDRRTLREEFNRKEAEWFALRERLESQLTRLSRRPADFDASIDDDLDDHLDQDLDADEGDDHDLEDVDNPNSSKPSRSRTSSHRSATTMGSKGSRTGYHNGVSGSGEAAALRQSLVEVQREFETREARWMALLEEERRGRRRLGVGSGGTQSEQATVVMGTEEGENRTPMNDGTSRTTDAMARSSATTSTPPTPTTGATETYPDGDSYASLVRQLDSLTRELQAERDAHLRARQDYVDYQTNTKHEQANQMRRLATLQTRAESLAQAADRARREATQLRRTNADLQEAHRRDLARVERATKDEEAWRGVETTLRAQLDQEAQERAAREDELLAARREAEEARRIVQLEALGREVGVGTTQGVAGQVVGGEGTTSRRRDESVADVDAAADNTTEAGTSGRWVGGQVRRWGRNNYEGSEGRGRRHLTAGSGRSEVEARGRYGDQTTPDTSAQVVEELSMEVVARQAQVEELTAALRVSEERQGLAMVALGERNLRVLALEEELAEERTMREEMRDVFRDQLEVAVGIYGGMGK
jgi:hypothetical protein